MTSQSAPATVAQALLQARSLGIDRLDAQLLVAHVLGRVRTWVIGHDDAALTPEAAAILTLLFSRRSVGEPLAYLVGAREFHGLVLHVTPDVLVPRPETEVLVDWALELLAGVAAPRVVDLGTGSGAVALSIKRSCPQAEVHATDLSDAALSVARGNGRALALQVQWHRGPWWQAAPVGRFDLALCNPPYVAAGDPHLSALWCEPALALTPAGDRGDGLADIERVAAGATARLRDGGWLLVEHGSEQGPSVRARFQTEGFLDVQTRPDLAGRPRVTGGRWSL